MKFVDLVIEAYISEKKVFACGNGGNAAYVANFVVDINMHPFVSEDKSSHGGKRNLFHAINLCEASATITGITNDYDSIVKRGSDINEGIIYFYLKNNKIRGACGIGKFGKIGKEIKLAGILSKAKKEISENKLSDINQKLQKL